MKFMFRADRVRKLDGFTLKPGMYAGRDARGLWISTRVLQKGDPGRHMRLFRLDPARGWVAEWESSETTREIIREVIRDGGSFRFELNCVRAPSNIQARVWNPSGAVVFR